MNELEVARVFSMLDTENVEYCKMCVDFKKYIFSLGEKLSYK